MLDQVHNLPLLLLDSNKRYSCSISRVAEIFASWLQRQSKRESSLTSSVKSIVIVKENGGTPLDVMPIFSYECWYMKQKLNGLQLLGSVGPFEQMHPRRLSCYLLMHY